MKKFKVIEESRFLHKQDMQILAGGACAPVTSTCTMGAEHGDHCISGMIYNTCIGVAPYDSWMCGIRIYYHCDSTRTFDHSTCGGAPQHSIDTCRYWKTLWCYAITYYYCRECFPLPTFKK